MFFASGFYHSKIVASSNTTTNNNKKMVSIDDFAAGQSLGSVLRDMEIIRN